MPEIETESGLGFPLRLAAAGRRGFRVCPGCGYNLGMIELRCVSRPGLVFSYVSDLDRFGRRIDGLYLAVEVTDREVLAVGTDGVRRMFSPDCLVEERSATDFTNLESAEAEPPETEEFKRWKDSIAVDWR